MSLSTGLKASILTLTSVRLFGEPSEMAFDSEHSTLGQLILDIEATVTPVGPTMSKLLDDLINSGVYLLEPEKRSSKFATADDMLSIDNMLIENNFVYPHKGLTHLLSDGLGDTFFSEMELQQVANARHNERRKGHILAHPDGPFHVADCDVASFIYLSILEKCQFPANLIEAPGHNFVRCFNEDGSYFNWETMDGIELTDAQYISAWRIPQDMIDKGVYMTPLTEQNVLGYCHYLVGILWFTKNNYKRAIQEYESATELYGHSPMPWNNLGWVYAVAEDDSIRSGDIAIEYAIKAVEIERSDGYLDTLACSYAEAGDFGKAIELEEEAYSINPSPDYKRTIDGFRQGKTWREMNCGA